MEHRNCKKNRHGLSRWLVFVSLVSTGVAMNAAAAESDADVARRVAESWVAIVDGAEYARSWETLAVELRRKVSREDWATDMRTLRAPLGALQERSLIGARFVRDLPDAPPGEYMVVQYSSRYEHFPAVLETIVPMRGDDGVWRVAGYFIRGDIQTAPPQ